jgi:hypothetical protein
MLSWMWAVVNVSEHVCTHVLLSECGCDGACIPLCVPACMAMRFQVLHPFISVCPYCCA